MTRRHGSSNKKTIKKILKAPHWIVSSKRGRALSFLPSIVRVDALWLSSVPPTIFLCVTLQIAHWSKSIALQVETLPLFALPVVENWKCTLHCTMHNAQCTGERRGRPTRSRTNEQRALITWCITHHSHHSHHSLSWLMCQHHYLSTDKPLITLIIVIIWPQHWILTIPARPTIWMYSTLNMFKW